MAAAEREIIPFSASAFFAGIHPVKNIYWREDLFTGPFTGGNTRSPSDLVESVNGCIEFERVWADAPSDMAESLVGCIEIERFWQVYHRI